MKVNKRVPLTAGNFKDLRYGFTLPKFNVNGGDAWVYNPPLGEDKGYFRMLDFNGYNHNAIIPCQHYFPPFIYLDRTYEYQLTFDEYTTDGLSDWDDASMINLVDLFYDRTYYPCVLVYNISTNTTRYCTTELSLASLNTYDDKDVWIPIPLSHIGIGNRFKIYGALSTIKDISGNGSPELSTSIFSLACTEGYATSMEYVGQKYPAGKDITRVSGGVQYEMITRYRMWIHGVSMVVKNSGEEFSSVTFNAYYSIEGNTISDSGTIGERTLKIPKGETTVIIYNDHDPIDIDISGDYVPEECEVIFSCSMIINQTQYHLFSDILYPFG